MENFREPETIIEPAKTDIPSEPLTKPELKKKRLLPFILFFFLLLFSFVIGKYLSDQRFLKSTTQGIVVSPTQALIATPIVSITTSPRPFKIGQNITIRYTESTQSWSEYKGGFYSVKYPKPWYVFKNGFVSPNKECDTCGGNPLGFNPQAKIFSDSDKNLSLQENAITYTVKNWGYTDLTEAFPLVIVSRSQTKLDATWVSGLPGEAGHDLLFFRSPENDIYVFDFAGLYDINENNRWVDKTYYGELLRKIFSTLEIKIGNND